MSYKAIYKKATNILMVLIKIFVWHSKPLISFTSALAHFSTSLSRTNISLCGLNLFWKNVIFN